MKSNRTPFFSTPCLLGPLLLATNLMMFSLAGSADAQGNTKRGATVGGLAGAVAGAAIGDHNGEAGAGAAIGGIIGAFAGGLLGNAEDQKQAYEMQNFYRQNQNRWSQYRKSAVSCEDVVAMKNSGLSDQVIINQIQQRGVQRQLQVPEIIALHRQGVSDQVITSMQHAQIALNPANRRSLPPQALQDRAQIQVPTMTPINSYHLIPGCPPPRYYYPRERIHHHYHGYPSGIHIRF